MRKITTMAVLSMLMLALTATVALGAQRLGTPGNDVLRGTPYADTISGYAGDDALFGGRGRDAISGGSGLDRIFGGRGADVLDSTDDYGTPERDEVYCGRGFDRVIADHSDVVAGDCEEVTRVFG